MSSVAGKLNIAAFNWSQEKYVKKKQKKGKKKKDSQKNNKTEKGKEKKILKRTMHVCIL